jgi:sodium-dependent dicarboxylate transporter 2/3/5
LNYLTTVWNQLWQSHSNIKQMFSLSPSLRDEKVPEEQETSVRNKSNPKDQKPNRKPTFSKSKLSGLLLGPSLFVLILLFFSPEGLSFEGRAVLAITLWIAVWWITEAMPIPVTSLLPLVLFPITGALDSNTVSSAYGDSIIFLFLGGFLIALAMEKWNLHKRIAVSILMLVGTSTDRLILGFMVATGFLSMWISNTAAAMMMVPIGVAIIKQSKDSSDPKVGIISNEDNFSKGLMFGIAVSASIGGVGTLIGTPPNMILAGVVNQLYGIQISFGGWMLFAVPIAIILMAVAWVYLVKIAFPMKLKELPGGKEMIMEQRKELGKISYEEKLVLTVFLFAAFMWITRSFIWETYIPGLNDTMIAVVAAALLFLIPSKNKQGSFLLNWGATKELPWGTLLLFGGGLAIAAGFRESGLTEWMGEQLTVLNGITFVVLILIVTTFVKFLTEITSNTATATMIIPIMAALAAAVDIHPYALMFAATLSAACAFMLPVATPPNAVVFASGYLKITDMAKAGFWINVISIAVITLAIYYYLPLVWGIDITSFTQM